MTDPLAGWTVERTYATGSGRVVTRSRQGAGAPVVVKATPPGAAWSTRSALRREARLLDTSRGEGVVDLLDVIDRRGRTALVLAFVPAGTLAERAAPDPDEVIGRLEATVVRLHRAGVVHGALRPEHVALDADGRPVVVGFGAACRSNATTPDLSALTVLGRTLRSGA